MTYSSGGLIEASDLNGFIGGNVANVSGRINTVWAAGTGNAGYGQPALSNVSIGDTVSAGSDPDLGPVFPTQWQSLNIALNSVRLHQTGSSSGITTPVYGDTITYTSALQTQLTNAYNDRLTAATTGSTTTGTNDTWNVTAATSVAVDTYRTCRILFSSTDAIRYFFNAGGRISMIYSAVSNAATARSQATRDVVNNLGGFNNYAAYSNSGRTGTGGTVITNNTGIGYYNVVNTSILDFIVVRDGVNPYSSYEAWVGHWVFGGSANGSRGNDLRLILGIIAAADTTNIDITVTSRCDITYPSTTYLSNSWGTPTVSYS